MTRNFDESSIALATSLIAPAQSFDDARCGTERIVLVDDNSNVRRLAKEILEELGYEVDAFASGHEALSAIAEDTRPIALLFTDYNMPELTGYELAQRVREMRPEVPILVASGLPEECVTPQDDSNSRYPFLQKPYSLRSLARKVREILDPETPAPVSGFVAIRGGCTG